MLKVLLWESWLDLQMGLQFEIDLGLQWVLQ